MLELNCRNMGDYLRVLDRNCSAHIECERLMTVSISRFFRDKRLWEILEKEIFPELIKKSKERISVWSAGCASGEEVYSLKIVWDSLAFSHSHFPQLTIEATEMNPVYLERAKAGIYPPSSLKELPEAFRIKYFDLQRGGGQYRIKASLKDGIMWQVRNILFDPPESSFQIIFLRNNLLTYYEEEFATPALGNILTHLSAGGFLIIGSHEKIPFKTSALIQYGSLAYVFKMSINE